MGKIIIAIVLMLGLCPKATAQHSPVQNLVWEQQYYFGNYDYALSWQAPALPHYELVGYNIYRDDQLFRFQPQTWLSNMGPNPNCGPEFMWFESQGDGFEVHVTAVYNPGGVESDYVETVFVQNNLLRTTDLRKPHAHFSPNPAKGVINIHSEIFTAIHLYDLSGKLIAAFKHLPQLDISNIAAGIYIIGFIGDNIAYDKIIIE